MLSALIGPISSLAGTWFENKLAKTKADGQAKVAEPKDAEEKSDSIIVVGESQNKSEILRKLQELRD